MNWMLRAVQVARPSNAGSQSQRFLLNLLLVILISVSNIAFCDERLHDQIARLIGAKRSSVKELAVSVLTLKNTREIEYTYEENEHTPFMPASTLKLVTSAAALSTLGPEFRFKTDLFTVGRKGEKVARLVLVGGGDPTINIEDSYLIAKAVKRRGIRSIDELVMSGSKFLAQAAKGDRAYDAALSPLSFNFNSLFFEVCPDQELGGPASVGLDVPDNFVKIINKVKTSRATNINIVASPNGRKYTVSGEIAYGGTCKGFYRSVPDPAEYFAYVLAAQLREVGVRVSSETISSSSKDAEEGEFIYSHTSKPLSEILFAMNHFSTNSFADHLIFALADPNSTAAGRWASGIENVNRFVREGRFHCVRCKLVDGSGLSHDNRVTSHFMALLLVDMLKDRQLAPDFQAMLAAPGRTGSLEDRASDFGNVVFRAKTGTLTGVRSLAGYVYLSNGDVRVFSILQNGIATREAGFKIEEAIVKLLGAES